MVHVAAAMNTPLISIFGANDPEEWKPIGDRFLAARAPSRQCDDVSVELVIEGMKKLLSKEISARRDSEQGFDISDKVFKQYVKELNKSEK